VAKSAVNVFTDGFAQAWVLWLLLIVPAAFWGWRVVQRRRACNAAELAGYAGSLAAHSSQRRWAIRLWLMGLAAVLVGCAGPWWGRDPNAPPPQGRDLYIVLDVSRSMLARDHAFLAENESRLDRAKRYITEVALYLDRRGGYRVGLILFAGQARLLCPLTQDFNHFLFALQLAHPDYLGPAGRLAREEDGLASGTSLRRAIQLGLDLAEPGAESYQDLLLVTDGDDVSGDWEVAAADARGRGRAVHVLGVGEPGRDSPIPTGDPDRPFLTRGPADELVTTTRRDDVLRELAEATRGDWVPEERSSHPAISWFQERLASLPAREWTADARAVKLHRAGWFFGLGWAALAASFVLADWPLGLRWRNE